MKQEINLRTREFTITREFYWPRLLITLAVIAAVVLLVGGSILVYIYRMQLETQNNYLTQESASLQARVIPLEEMEAKTRDLEKREKLAAELAGGQIPYSDYFKMIRRIARECAVETTSLGASGRERIRISGSGGSMSDILLFMQALEAANEGSEALYQQISYGGDEKYRYDIELILEAGGEQE